MTLQLNFPVSDFVLPDLDGKTHHLSDYRGKIVIVNFWSCECPHSARTDKAIMTMFVQCQDEVTMLSIASNRSENVEAIKNAVEERRLPSVLLDADCRVADLFVAQTTPHVFVIDHGGILRYRGAVDDGTFRNQIPTRFFLHLAVESLLAGKLPAQAESQPYSCTIIREV